MRFETLNAKLCFSNWRAA